MLAVLIVSFSLDHFLASQLRCPLYALDMKNLGSLLLLLAASTSYVASSPASNGVTDITGREAPTLEGQWQHMPISQRRCTRLA